MACIAEAEINPRILSNGTSRPERGRSRQALLRRPVGRLYSRSCLGKQVRGQWPFNPACGIRDRPVRQTTGVRLTQRDPGVLDSAMSGTGAEPASAMRSNISRRKAQRDNGEESLPRQNDQSQVALPGQNGVRTVPGSSVFVPGKRREGRTVAFLRW